MKKHRNLKLEVGTQVVCRIEDSKIAEGSKMENEVNLVGTSLKIIQEGKLLRVARKLCIVFWIS